MPTIDDAHRNHELGKVLALVGKNLASQYALDETPHDAAHTACTDAVTDLTAIQAPPGDVQTHVDTEMQSLYDATVAERDIWNSIIAEDPEAPYVHPVKYSAEQASPGYAVATRDHLDNYITAILAEWTPV